jgi:hypothetical protein
MTATLLIDKLGLNQTEHVEHEFRHLVVKLRGRQTITGLIEDPSMWLAIQSDRAKRLSRGDRVSIISADGLEMADSCIVRDMQKGHVFLTKPLRLIQFAEVALFQTEQRAVVHSGAGFAVKRLRDGVIEDRIFASEEQAKAAILREMPVAVA